MASVRSLLAKWLGGAGAIPQAGIRSLLARWVGGAGTTGLSQGGGVFGGSADVARTRSYEASGGGVFDGSATIAQGSGEQAVPGGGGLPPKYKPSKERKQRARQTYSYASTGGLELSAAGLFARNRTILASGGVAIGAEYEASRVRAITSVQILLTSGAADVESYDAIYDTEDEELMLLAA